MLSSRMGGGCWCFLAVGSLLLLGPPAQAKAPSWAPSSSAWPGRLFWPKEEAMLYRQASQAQRLVLDYLSKKHNATYYRAPGQKSQVTVETAFGRAYYVNTVLVRAKCPEGYTDVNPTDCVIAPNSPKLECNMVVVLLFENDHPHMSEDNCRELKEPPADPPSLPRGPSDGEEQVPEEETEVTPYI